MKLASGAAFAFEQVTDYPWSGEVRIVIRQAPAASVALRLRIPGWSSGATLAVNGQPVGLKRDHGYAVVAQTWQAGDTVTLSLPMPSQLVAADPRVEEDRNQVAVMRGPVLYCVESPDLAKGVDVPSVYLSSKASFEPKRGIAGAKGELADDAVTLTGAALHRADPMQGALYRPLGQAPLEPFEVKLIPYYAWSNRGKSAMSVWLPVVWEK